MDAILGLDIGTTSIKAVLFDADGREIGVAGRSYPLLAPQPGWVEQDAEAVGQALLETLADAVKLSQGRRIAALALAAQAGSIIPCDAAGDPVYPMITFLDSRSAGISAGWNADGTTDTIRRLSGWRPYPGLPLPSMAWLRQNRPDVHSAAKRFLGPADFCIHRLTGEFATDLSAAAEMLLVGLDTGEWQPELCELAGASPAMQSALGWAGRQVGRITTTVAERTGLPEGTPVIAGGHDQCCACLGMGMLDPGTVMLSTGTAWVITGVVTTPSLDAIPGRMDLNFHAAPQRWTASQYLGGFGATIDWWLDQAWQSPDPAQALSRGNLYGFLDTTLIGSTPGSHGVLFVPLSGPSQAAGKPEGAFAGLTLAHTRGDMSRAILESTAYEARWALDNLRTAGMPVDELWIAGGASRSPVWPQILADVCGMRIVLADYSSWAALGAAVLAGWGVGLFATLADGVARLRPPVRTVEPDAGLASLYAGRLAAYQQLTLNLS